MDGQSGPKLVREKGSLVLQTQELDLVGEEVIVGRDPEADLVIPSPLVSRRHARLFTSDGEYLI
jgi:pSer/pThr/pTyr-binding forkhead associated (FHA) protein